MQIRVFKPEISVYTHLTLYNQTSNGIVVYRATFENVPYTQGDRIPPTITLSAEEAQQLMDGLYDCGYRPSRQDIK